MEELSRKQIPVHTFYVRNDRQTAKIFGEIAARSSGICEFLDCNGHRAGGASLSQGAQKLKDLVCERVVFDVGHRDKRRSGGGEALLKILQDLKKAGKM